MLSLRLKLQRLSGIFLSLFFLARECNAQMITGIWKGKINNKKTELKLIQRGDSLLGTSYYFESPRSYRRFTLRGFFDPQTQEAVWWDDQLIEEKKGVPLWWGATSKISYRYSADFNCPGSGKMLLQGRASSPNNPYSGQGRVNLEKTGFSIFQDEWDFILENYTNGTNEPFLIDSVAAIAMSTHVPKIKASVTQPEPNEKGLSFDDTIKPATLTVPDRERDIQVTSEKDIEEHFIKRKKTIAVEIPLSGDYLDLYFYDNAEIDGDSISLYLNNKLLFQHIQLKATAFALQLSVKDLAPVNELVMVAENLGTIPPNTSYMLAIIDNKRYEAIMKSTEESSAVIRLIKK